MGEKGKGLNPNTGQRVRVIHGDMVRYGTVVDFLSKEETKQCAMFGQLIKAKMDDSGREEEFLYDWEIVGAENYRDDHAADIELDEATQAIVDKFNETGCTSFRMSVDELAKIMKERLIL